MDNSLTLVQKAILVEAEYLKKRDGFDSIGIIFLYDRLLNCYRLRGVEAFINDLQLLEDTGYLNYYKGCAEVDLTQKGIKLASNLLETAQFAPTPFGCYGSMERLK